MKRLAIAAALLLAAFAPQSSGPAYPAPARPDIEPLVASLYYSATADMLDASEERTTAAGLPALLQKRKTVTLASLEDCRWELFDLSTLQATPSSTTLSGYHCRAKICIPVAYPTDCTLHQRADDVELRLHREGKQWRLDPDREWAHQLGLNLGGCYRKAELTLQDETYSTSCSSIRVAMR